MIEHAIYLWFYGTLRLLSNARAHPIVTPWNPEISHVPLEHLSWKMKGVHAVFVASEEGFDYLDFNRFF